MSAIDKLLIRGIRSFDPHQQHVIEFYTPLTIIVGHNGAGKTTIIECLKYATTGDLPPNSKGGAFVHDPKLSNEGEVKAQIKLKFRNVRGGTMVVTRSLQSTQKRNKLEQKTLESLLMTTDPLTGEQVSISSRCAELDTEIPFHLGVSRAVLENVIFCHQEESSWPLSEPSILKKKFDDIFAATRYTKALDTIKSLRKEMMAQIKLEQQKLEYLRADREKAAKLQSARESTEKRTMEARETINNLDANIASVQKMIRRLNDDLQGLSDLQTETDRFQHEYSMATRSRLELKATLKEMKEPSEELQAILEQHALRARTTEAQLDAMKHREEETRQELELLSAAYSEKCTEQGAFRAQYQILERKRRERGALVRELAGKLGANLGNEREEEAIHALRASFESKRALYEGEKKSNDEQSAAFLANIQSLLGQQYSFAESRKANRKAMDELCEKTAAVLDRISSLSDSDIAIEELEQQLVEQEASLVAAQEFMQSADYEARLANVGKQRQEVEQEIMTIGSQMTRLNQHAEMRAKIELKKIERARKQEALSRIWKDIEAEALQMRSGEPVFEELDRDCENHYREKESTLNDRQGQLERAKASASLATSKYEHASSLLAKKQVELDEKNKRIASACGSEDFPVLLEKCERRLCEIKERLGNSTNASSIYSDFAIELQRRHQCPLCERGFDELHGSGEAGLLLKLKAMIACLPKELAQIETEKTLLETQLDELRPLRTAYDDIARLRLRELPDLASEASNLENEVMRLSRLCDDLRSEVSTAILAEKRAAFLKKRAEEVSRVYREMLALDDDIAYLERESGLAGASTQNSDQLRARLEELQRSRVQLQAQHDDCSAELKKRESELQLRETRFRNTKEKMMRLRLDLGEVNRLKEQRGELEKTAALAAADLARLEVEADRVNRLLQDANRVRDEHLAKAAAMERDQNTFANSMQGLLHLLQQLTADITCLDGQYGEKMQEKISQDIDALDKRVKTLQKEARHCNEEASGFAKEASQVQMLERTIQDNLKYRSLGQQIGQLERKLDELRTKVGDFDKHSALNQINRQQLKQSDLMGERSGLLGEIRQLEDQYKRLTEELEGDYRDIETGYRDQFIRHSATCIASDDLDKYAKALDQAIMKYHALKMDEINKIIRELWTSTYQGSDIDTIEIRADHETTAGNRCYNYRVIMVKGDTELDMRGRSSAGQRVLTSLIIRLALAESFGLHCGILALDEPTTNLDRANIDGLAEALAGIIRTRRQQSNFQLIIITHDEEFVQALGRSECADYYWRVFRDHNQHSAIERQSMQSMS